jgi:hypothetical protein
MNPDQFNELPSPLGAAEAEAAVQAILKRTVGKTCAAAESMLVGRADGTLATGDSDLLEGHLEHCPGCRAIAETLVWLRAELPALAEADPGPTFVESVLALTSRRTAPAGQRDTGVYAGHQPTRAAGVSWLDDLRDAGSAAGRHLTAVMHRPRAALELAFGTSLIACLLLGSPAPRVREVTSEVGALVSSVPSPQLIMASVTPPEGWDGATGKVRGLIEKAEERAPQGILARLVKAWRHLAATLAAVRDHGPKLGQALLRLDLAGMWKEAESIRQAEKKGSEPANPAVRPGNDRGMASPGGTGDDPASNRGGTS